MSSTASSPHRPGTARAPRPHRQRSRQVSGAARFLGRVLRAAAAGVVLAALVGGVPWGLWQVVGWPLPARVPTLAEIQGVLLGPMNTMLLLDVLACVSWIVWAAFSVDVARCARDTVRDLRRPGTPRLRASRSPTHAVAAVLVGAIALSIVGNRAAHLATAAAAGEHRSDPSTATSAPGRLTPPTLAIGAELSGADQRPSVHLAGAVRTPWEPSPPLPNSIVVRAPDPRTGIHDSLWRIADRTLGDGARWPEIFELNEGKPQPDGGTLTRPSLIFPGEELQLPDTGSDQPGAEESGAAEPAPAPVRPTPAPEPPVTSTPQRPAEEVPAPTRVVPDDVPAVPVAAEPGLDWGTEWHLGAGLAAAISAALVVARRRHRRRYRPGSGRRDDLPVAPVVYQLRLAHLRTQPPDLHDEQFRHDGADDERDRGGSPGHLDGSRPGPADLAGTGSDDVDAVDLDNAGAFGTAGRDVARPRPGRLRTAVVGTRAGREVALDLAAARGLGLVGPGAAAASRALLIDALAARLDQGRRGWVIAPVDDLGLLLGPGGAAADPPTALRLTATLDDALDELDEAIRARTGRDGQTGRDEPGGARRPGVLLVAQPEQRNRARLQSVLDNGSTLGIAGILLGQWQPGVTAYVNEDGTVSTTGPGAGEALRGARLFHLGETETTQLLNLLRRAQPEHPVPEHPVPEHPVPEHPVPDEADRDKPDAERAHGELAKQRADAAAVDGLEMKVDHADTADGSSRPVTAPSPRRDQDTAAAPAGPKPPAPATPPAGATANQDSHHRAAVRVTVLGRPQVFWRPSLAAEHGATAGGHTAGEQEITGALQPRTRELLTFLAVHRDGTSREELAENLWPNSPPERTASSVNSALTRLRRSLDQATHATVPDIVLAGDGRVRLDPTVVTVDFWDFQDATTARRAATCPQDRHDAHHRIVDAYTGPLADGQSAAWIETARESVRRTALDAVVALARELVDTDPHQTLDLLETARAFDSYNESVYRDIMRLQSTLGLLDAIPRTLALLTTRLAEFGDQPTGDTITLAERLRRRHHNPDNTGNNPDNTGNAHSPDNATAVPAVSPRPARPSDGAGTPAVRRRRAG